MTSLGSDFILNSVIASPLVTPRVRWRLLRMSGMPVESCVIASRVFFGGVHNVRLGRGAVINHFCFVDASAPVTIGRSVHIGMNVTLATSSHELGPGACRAGAVTTAPITIEDGAWLGAGVIVMPGVTIASGCVVAGGAIVTKDTSPDGIYAGNPARRIRDIDESVRAPVPASNGTLL